MWVIPILCVFHVLYQLLSISAGCQRGCVFVPDKLLLWSLVVGIDGNDHRISWNDVCAKVRTYSEHVPMVDTLQ